MIYTQIIVEGQQLEGVENLDIVFSYSFKDFRDPTRTTGNTSTTIQIPRTKENERILGIPSDVNVFSSFNKNEGHAAYAMSESVVILDAMVYVLGANLETIEIALRSGAGNLKTIFEDKKLTDLNLSDLTHTYSDAVVFGSWTAGEDYVYPMVDYGAWRNKPPSVITTDFTELRPAIYIERLLRQVCRDNNITLETRMFERPVLKKMMLCFGNDEFVHTQEWVDERVVEVNYLVRTLYAVGAVLILPTEIQDDLGQWDPVLYEYTANQDHIMNVNVFVRVSFIAGTPELKLEYYDTGMGVWADVPDSNIALTTGDQNINMDVNMLNGWKLRAYVDNGVGDAVTIDRAALTTAPSKLIYRESDVDMAVNMPDMKQIDFLKMLISAFNLLVNYNDTTRVLSIECYNDYFNGSVDWSDKLDLSDEPEIRYVDDFLKQSQDFVYEQPEDDRPLTDYNAQFPRNVLFGDGQNIFDNSYNGGDATKLADLKLRPIYSRKTYRFQGKYIRFPSAFKIGAEQEQVTGIGPFWMVFAGMTTVSVLSEGTKVGMLLTEAATVETDIPLFYFVKQDYNVDAIDALDVQLAFDVPVSEGLVTYSGRGLKDEFYGEMLTNYNQVRIVECLLNLKVSDISALDFRKLVYIEYFSSYFAINNIDQFNPSNHESTKVELIRINR